MFTIVFNKSVVDAASKKLSYRRGTARRAMSVEILTNAARTIVGKIAIEKACSWRTTLKVTQGYRNFRYSTGLIWLHISVLQSQRLSGTVSRYYHIYSVRDWRWSYKVCCSQKDKPRGLFCWCVNFVVVVVVIICPITISYSMEQIIKPVCLCSCVRVSVCPSACTLTLAFLDGFSPKLAQTKKPPKIKTNSLVVNIALPFPI